jgi:hypothetical protein
MAEIAPTRLEAWLMATDRSRSPSGTAEGLSRTAQSMLLWLVRCGDAGIFPKPKVFCELLQVSDSAFYRAKQSLKASGLVLFTPAEFGGEAYQLAPPGKPPEIQLAAWRQINPLLRAQQSGLDQTSETLEAASETPETPTVDTPPAEPAAKRARGESKPKAKQGLNDEHRTWILTSADNLDVYLRFGQAAIGKTMAECVTSGLPSAGVDWLAFGQSSHEDCYSPQWKVNQFAAYYWHLVGRHREKMGIPLSLPQWGRLTGELKNLLATTTHFNAYQHLYLLGNHFDLIQFQMGNFGQGKVLCESSINDQSIRQKVTLIITHGTQWLQAEYDRMAAATRPAYRGGE